MKICGVDEVGCSAIAGPVVSCAALIDTSVPYIDGVDDSKKLDRAKRERLVPLIRERAVFAFGAAGPRRIEKINIYWARYEAMSIAIRKLLRRGHRIDLILVDGLRVVPDLPDGLRQEAWPKADANYWEVACASILAKVHRDNLMAMLDARHPGYGWRTNAGYYSPEHRRGIVLNGPTPYHRRTFALFKGSLDAHTRYGKFLADGGSALEEFLCQDARCGQLLATDGKCVEIYRKPIRAGGTILAEEGR
jgi:ribonuclease HII